MLEQLAYESKNVQFEPQDPEVGSTVTTNAIESLSGLGTQNPIDLTVLIINWGLTLLGVVFLVLILYGGILWMMSAGKEESIEKAKKILTASIIGLVIVMASYGITYFIFEYLVNITAAGYIS